MSSAAMADKISHQQWFFRWVRDAAADVEQGQSNCTARYKAKQRHYRRANIGNKLGKLLSLLYGLLRFLKNLSFLGFFLRWLCLFRSFFACFRSLFGYRLRFCLCFQSLYFFFSGSRLGFGLLFFGGLLCLQLVVFCN